MADYHIVMADVIGSRSYDGMKLSAELGRLVAQCNGLFKEEILSPYTVTLGDEFQGVAASLRTAVESIIYLEEELLTSAPFFQLRYVVVFGQIETPINPEIAHGMVGPGLALAREMLEDHHRGRPRFQFRLNHESECELNSLFRLLDSIESDWGVKDHCLVGELIREPDDKTVAVRFGKDRSQIWKRRKSLKIDEYRLVKMLISKHVEALERHDDSI